MLPLLMAGLGAVSPLMEMLMPGDKGGMERMEDPITTQALQQMRGNRERMLNQNPEAMRRATEMQLNNQQQAAIQSALGAATSQMANQGMGGDISAPMASAISNSQAAIGAAGQFAGAYQQNNAMAMQARQQQDAQLQQLANEYGNQAQHVNLIQRQGTGGVGNQLLKGLYGAATMTGLGGSMAEIFRGKGVNETADTGVETEEQRMIRLGKASPFSWS